MTDPMQPSPEHSARLDQIRAGMRDLAEALDAAVEELRDRGWTDSQARELVMLAARQTPPS